MSENDKDGNIEAGTPVPLFQTQVGGAVQLTNRQFYPFRAMGSGFS
jgi:hypothetical protein